MSKKPKPLSPLIPLDKLRNVLSALLSPSPVPKESEVLQPEERGMNPEKPGKTKKAPE